MRTVYLYEEIFTRQEFAIEVPDEVSDAQAEEWAIDEVMYNLSGKYATGREDVLRDEFVDAKLVYEKDGN